MAPEHTPRWLVALAAMGVFAVVVAGLGTLASLVTTNTLLVGSSWRLPALLSVAVVVVTLVAVALAGGPTDRWKRTPYW